MNVENQNRVINDNILQPPNPILISKAWKKKRKLSGKRRTIRIENLFVKEIGGKSFTDPPPPIAGNDTAELWGNEKISLILKTKTDALAEGCGA